MASVTSCRGDTGIERRSVWRDNVYPDCARHVLAHLHSCSVAPNSEWSCNVALCTATLDYIRQVSQAFGVTERVCFGRTERSGVWVAFLNLLASSRARTGLISIPMCRAHEVPCLLPGRPGDDLEIVYGGGGGHGDRAHLDPGLVHADILESYVSEEAARRQGGCSSIALGPTETSIERGIEDERRRRLGRMPMHRFGGPIGIAQAVASSPP